MSHSRDSAHEREASLGELFVARGVVRDDLGADADPTQAAHERLAARRDAGPDARARAGAEREAHGPEDDVAPAALSGDAVRGDQREEPGAALGLAARTGEEDQSAPAREADAPARQDHVWRRGVGPGQQDL